jgi:iron complex transport system substrate-binding protein
MVRTSRGGPRRSGFLRGGAARMGLCLLLAIGVLSPGWCREITDMAGRKVTVPDKIHKVFAADPYTNVLLYVVAPDLSLGLQPGCLPLRPEDRKFFRREVSELPELTTQSPGGERAQVNMEEVLRLKPDIVIAIGAKESNPMRTGNRQRTEERFSRLNLPLVFIDVDSIEDYPAGIEFLGKLLGREKDAKRLSQYTKRAFADVKKAVDAVPLDQHVRVYYAESADGLATESDRSLHADAIRMAGGNIVHRGELKTHQGMEKVSLEQILIYDPEVIISQEPEFATNAYRDPRWQKVKAVVNHRIYTVPRTPFNWIDRPPSVMRVLGLQWLTYHFYPKTYHVNIRKQIREYCLLFLGVEVTEANIDEWLR